MGSSITHINEWIVGNHEDGYLIGINNLIQIFEELLADNTALELQQAQQVRTIAANDEKEADHKYNDNAGDDKAHPTTLTSTPNQTARTSEKETMASDMQTEHSSIHLPIDAMKIDQQSLHQSNSDSAEKK